MTRHLVRHDPAARRPALADAGTSRAGRGSRAATAAPAATAATAATLHPDPGVLGPLLDAAWMGLWLLDTGARTTYVNRTMAELLATSPEAAIGRSLFEFLDETAHQEAEALLGGTTGAPPLPELADERDRALGVRARGRRVDRPDRRRLARAEQ